MNVLILLQKRTGLYTISNLHQIPAILVHGKFDSNFHEKTNIFNNFSHIYTQVFHRLFHKEQVAGLIFFMLLKMIY